MYVISSNRRFRIHNTAEELFGLHLQSLHGEEGLSQLFSFKAELVQVLNPDSVAGDGLGEGKKKFKLGKLAIDIASDAALGAAGGVLDNIKDTAEDIDLKHLNFKRVTKNVSIKNVVGDLKKVDPIKILGSAISPKYNPKIKTGKNDKKFGGSLSKLPKIPKKPSASTLGIPQIPGGDDDFSSQKPSLDLNGFFDGDPIIEPNAILGKPITISADLVNGGQRFFNGVISHFKLIASHTNYITYEATISPNLWLLTKTSDCRAFLNKSVIDIVSEVLDLHGMCDIENRLSGEYKPLEYCVQYRETDFNFISRLLEKEGIYYFFSHNEDSHTLVLADGPSAHQALLGKNKIPYNASKAGENSSTVKGLVDSLKVPGLTDFLKKENVLSSHIPSLYEGGNSGHFSHWATANEIQPESYVTKDFDFKAPKKDLLQVSESTEEHIEATLPLYDYPGEYSEPAEGEVYTKTRMQEIQVMREVCTGSCTVENIAPGMTFTLSEHPVEAQNRDYLTVFAEYHIENAGLLVDLDNEEKFSVNVEVIDAKINYRAPRVSPKPMIRGVQTAIIVGPENEEIYTDKFGRVMCQFHWDRYGKFDENSSSWVRVSQDWAGKNWGSIYLPRIGQEVIVDFIEGDPDRPIITGRVYNTDNMPPYDLPENKSKSGIKTRSTKGGLPQNFNEIRFDDKLEAEQLYVHAERNMDVNVENDQTLSVDNDREKHIGNNQSEHIVNNKRITVGADHTETIEKNKTLSVGENHEESIGNDCSIDIGNESYLHVGASHEETINENMSVSIGQNLTESVSGAHEESVTESYQLHARSISISADDSIVLRVGSAQIVMRQDGTISIEGSDISVNASGNLNMNANRITSN